MAQESFSQIITQAVRDMADNGFADMQRLQNWIRKIKHAADKEIPSEYALAEMVRHGLVTQFKRSVTNHGIIKQFPQVSRFTIDHIAPILRNELDRRILASTSLIKLNREQAIEKTLQRFSGWATSIPIGGSKTVDKIEIKASIGKSLQTARYEVRRLNIDQGHKMLSNIAAVVAIQTGAIAARWRHVHMANYDGRPEHIERDGKIYALRGNWALENGLMNKCDGYSDEIDQPSEFVYCFPPDSKIPFASGIEKAFRHWYSGELTTLVMASGKTLRGTPNHPVLTPDGWVALGSLKKGDYVIEVASKLVPLKENQNDGIPTIAEIFSSLQENGVMQSRSGSAADFHGDGSDSNVDTVFAADGLTESINAFRPKVIDNLALERTGFPADNLCNLLDGLPFTAKPVEIVNVDRTGYSGHVYNLQTKDGWYVTDGIITHNCRCKWIYINHLNQLPGDFLTQKGRATLAETRK